LARARLPGGKITEYKSGILGNKNKIQHREGQKKLRRIGTSRMESYCYMAVRIKKQEVNDKNPERNGAKNTEWPATLTCGHMIISAIFPHPPTLSSVVSNSQILIMIAHLNER